VPKPEYGASALSLQPRMAPPSDPSLVCKIGIRTHGHAYLSLHVQEGILISMIDQRQSRESNRLREYSLRNVVVQPNPTGSVTKLL